MRSSDGSSGAKDKPVAETCRLANEGLLRTSVRHTKRFRKCVHRVLPRYQDGDRPVSARRGSGLPSVPIGRSHESISGRCEPIMVHAPLLAASEA